MLIDWFTVVAQVLNFLILVWLLKRFLYRPILNAIDVREKRIAAEVADANTKKAEAQKDREAFQGKNKAFDEQRSALLSKAIEEANSERDRLLAEARKSVDALTERQRTMLQAEAGTLNKALCRRVQQEVFDITRKTLGDLASVSLEERLVDVFVRRLGTMDEAMKKIIAAAISTSTDPTVVRSAFNLPAAQQATVQKALDDAFASDVRVQFETTPAFISGIEFTAGGQKLGWTIGGYLASLKQSVDDVLALPLTSTSPAKVQPTPAAIAKAS
jgi:F-type H+-transporting ATPase subunit b